MTEKTTAPKARTGDLRPDRRSLLQLTALSAALGMAGGNLGLATSRAAAAAPAPAAGDAFARLAQKKVIDIGIIIFPQMDQIDFTGPFEVLVRMPGARIHVAGTEKGPFKDHMGMILTPEMALADMPEMDLLVMPGGPGQEDLMRDEALLSALRTHWAAGKPVFSVCTGSFLLGAAGLLKGKRATTYWAVLDLLPYFGAQAMQERVVVDGNLISAAGVTAGIDGALKVVSMLRGDRAAETVQLSIQYQPEPGFNAGSPETAPPDVVAQLRKKLGPSMEQRRNTARTLGQELGIPLPG